MKYAVLVGTLIAAFGVPAVSVSAQTAPAKRRPSKSCLASCIQMAALHASSALPRGSAPMRSGAPSPSSWVSATSSGGICRSLRRFA